MMKIEHGEKYAFSIIFLGVLFMLSFLSIPKTVSAIITDIQQGDKEADKSQNTTDNSNDEISIIDMINSEIDENIYGRYSWIEAYGSMSRLLNKKEINGFSYGLDKNNAYNSLNFWNNVADHDHKRYAQQLSMLKENVEKNGGHLVFLGFPNKLNPKWDEGYEGVPYNDYNEKMDELLLWNRRYGIDSIDYRDVLEKSRLSFKEMFYKTDHHWTGYAAFIAFEELVSHLNEKYNAAFDENGYYRDINNYEVKWHENIFMGADGRNVGLNFGDGRLEDFQTVKPKFKGNIEWNGRKGDYTDTVIREEKLQYDSPYESDCFGYYLDGVCQFDEIKNNDNPDGPKILFIRDSFASPIIIDMIPLASKIDCVWGKYATDSYVKKMVNDGKYDYVIVGYYTADILPNFFHFYENDYKKGVK